MERVSITERPDWREKATEYGFNFHTMYGEPYWSEEAYYKLSLAQVEKLEEVTAELPALGADIDVPGLVIDAGADAVIGTHPHVLQGMEYYRGKPIIYSLGNFCFGGNKNPADKNTAIYQQAFTLINGELQQGIDAQIIPCTLSSVSSYNDFRPTVA